jgi:hypothetical protein
MRRAPKLLLDIRRSSKLTVMFIASTRVLERLDRWQSKRKRRD